MPTLQPVAFSSQSYTISKGSEREIFLFRNTQRFILQYFDWVKFSEQAEQDLVLFLKVGAKVVFRTGKYELYGEGQIKYEEEARQESMLGLFLSSISSENGNGYPDNFHFYGQKIPILIPENLFVSVLVKNQSSIYDHPVQISIQGIVA